MPIKIVKQIASQSLAPLLLLFISHSVFAADGLEFKNKYFHSGKADFHFLHNKSSNQYNTMWWSPGFKGGWGTIDHDAAAETTYFGGYLRPLLPQDGNGELIFGFHQVDAPASTSNEFQADYRFPFGLGVGGGFVDRENGGPDVEFGKISFRATLNEWKYLISAQYQELGRQKDAGAYLALYDDQFMFVHGSDGEMFRSTFGFISKSDDESSLRPAFEVLFVDNSIGDLDGNRFLFINGTLKFQGGFLSNPARLGRAMGPTGTEFGNPLGFLGPTWNRRLDLWELGDLVNFRADRVTNSDSIVTERYEGLVYPFQLSNNKMKVLDRVYIGGFHHRAAKVRSSGILGGIFTKMSFLSVGLGADYNVDTHETKIIVGMIDKF